MARQTSLEGPYYLAGQEIDSPLINAAGSLNGTNEDEILSRVRELARTGIGAIKLGSFTLMERAGVGIYEYDEATGESYNFMGLPNPGARRGAVITRQAAEIAHNAGKPLIVSCSPTGDKGLGSPIEQSIRLAHTFLSSGADRVEINTSCPHTDEGGQGVPIFGYDIHGMYGLGARVNEEFGETERDKLDVKLPPQLLGFFSAFGIKVPEYLLEMETPWLHQMARVLNETRAFRLAVISNTIPNQKDIGGYSASLSGDSPRVRLVANLQTLDLARDLDPSIDIVSSLGVGTGEEMMHRLESGAVAVEGVTRLWRPDQPYTMSERVTQMLEEFHRAIDSTAA